VYNFYLHCKGFGIVVIDVTSDLKTRSLLTCTLHTLAVSVCAMLSIKVLSFDTDTDTDTDIHVRSVNGLWWTLDLGNCGVEGIKCLPGPSMPSSSHRSINNTYMDHCDHVFACDYCELGRVEK
jgi:hypothetical protein